MMHHRRWIGWMMVLGILLPCVGRATEPGIHDRLEIGARFVYFELEDDVRGSRNNRDVRRNFIGSIWGLEEKQSYVPKPYVQYSLGAYGGIGIAYDWLTVETVDWGSEEETFTSSDGSADVQGPALYVFGRYPNSTRFTPFAELGLAYYFADFEEDAEWAATAPGYRFEVDDTTAYYFALGCDFRLADRWTLGVYFRQLNDADVDTRAYFTPGPRVGRAGSFPFDSRQYAVSVLYRF